METSDLTKPDDVSDARWELYLENKRVERCMHRRGEAAAKRKSERYDAGEAA